jgi:dipeptidyl aminopeptidase/acylaminoacyl peptidase
MKDKIYFSNDSGYKLCGVISNPTGNTKIPIITLCHGLTTSKDGRTCSRLEAMLNRKGMSTFRFDFFGHGESEGEFEDITLSEAVKDVLEAIHVLKDSGYSKIGLMGSSFGGFASLIAASQLTDLILLALKSPVSDYLRLLMARDQDIDIPHWKQNGFISVKGSDGQSLKLNYPFFEDAETIKSGEAIKKIKIPTLIVHGDEDRTVPLKQSIQSARLLEDCRLEVIEGADHMYTQPRHFEKMLSLIVDFIIDNFGSSFYE